MTREIHANAHFKGTVTVGDGTVVDFYSGTGSPEGVVTGVVGSLWLRTDGGSGTAFYVKEFGVGNTGWTPYQPKSIILPGPPGDDGDDGYTWPMPGPPGATGAAGASGSSSSGNGARVYMTAGQVVASGNIDAIDFDAADFDTDTYWSAGNPSRLTVPSNARAGLYQVTANVEIDADAVQHQRGRAQIRVNGTAVESIEGIGHTTVGGWGYSVSALVNLISTSYVELWWSANDENQTVQSGLTGTSLSMVWQGYSGGNAATGLTVKDLGASRNSGTFDITGLAGLTSGNPVSVYMTAGAIASKGSARDEFEMTAIVATGYVLSSSSIRVYWHSTDNSIVVGNYEFGYVVGA